MTRFSWDSPSVAWLVFVDLLRTHIGGVPMLEAHSHATWGDDSECRVYKARTPPGLSLRVKVL